MEENSNNESEEILSQEISCMKNEIEELRNKLNLLADNENLLRNELQKSLNSLQEGKTKILAEIENTKSTEELVNMLQKQIDEKKLKICEREGGKEGGNERGSGNGGGSGGVDEEEEINELEEKKVALEDDIFELHEEINLIRTEIQYLRYSTSN